MAVTADQLVKAREPGRLREFIVKSGTTVYAGTMVFVELATGHIYNTATGGTSVFVGVAKTGLLGDGVKTIDVYTSGAFTLTGTTLAAADVGKPCKATDNYTFDTVANVATGATASVMIGYMTKYIDSTTGEVEIAPSSMLQYIDQLV